MKTIIKHVNAEPEPPSRRCADPIPPELETIILDCLAKRPEARPQSADELMARLDAVPLARHGRRIGPRSGGIAIARGPTRKGRRRSAGPA